MKYLLLLLVSSASFAKTFRVNDLAFLYPLTLSKSNYIKLKDIVPEKYLSGLSPKLVYGIDRTYLVGVKFAPCFKEMNSNKCLHQVRLVFQGSFPDYKDSRSTILFNDDAIHVFFNLSKVNLYSFLRFLRVRNRDNQTWIHNVLKKDRTAAAFNRSLKKIVRNKKPYLITAMEGDSVFVWSFFKVYPQVTEINRLEIFQVSGFQVDENSLVDANCVSISNKGCEGTINSTIWKIRKITSAKRTHVDAVDCASCHMVDALKAKIKFSRKDYREYLVGDAQKEFFKKEILDVSGHRNPSNMRQLGYFGRKPSISQRTISELKEQLKYLP